MGAVFRKQSSPRVITSKWGCFAVDLLSPRGCGTTGIPLKHTVQSQVSSQPWDQDASLDESPEKFFFFPSTNFANFARHRCARRCVFALRAWKLCAPSSGIRYRPREAGMSTPGDRRHAQVSRLPFSVDALMSERSHKRESVTMDGFHKPLVSIKSEPSDPGDCASWIPSPVRMSTPPRKLLFTLVHLRMKHDKSRAKSL